MHGMVTGQDPRKRCGDLDLKLENPLGFFESQRLVGVNDALLQMLGCQWDRPPLLPPSWDQPPLLDKLQPHRTSLESYALNQAWVDKDPRLCITYPAYLHILLRRIPLIVALREPLAVATSLYARNGFSLNRGLVLWWVYNYHIASHLCSKDLLVLYNDLLVLNDQSLQHVFGPFFECHKLRIPADAQAKSLISLLLKPQFNRAEAALNIDQYPRINHSLLAHCKNAYNSIVESSDQLASYKEHFNSLPHAVLECSARDQLQPETQVIFLHDRLRAMEFEMKNIVCSLEQKERDCVLFNQRLREFESSSSWKITYPLRALAGLFKATVRRVQYILLR